LKGLCDLGNKESAWFCLRDWIDRISFERIWENLHFEGDRRDFEADPNAKPPPIPQPELIESTLVIQKDRPYLLIKFLNQVTQAEVAQYAKRVNKGHWDSLFLNGGIEVDLIKPDGTIEVIHSAEKAKEIAHPQQLVT
jgi:hypothetical protein